MEKQNEDRSSKPECTKPETERLKTEKSELEEKNSKTANDISNNVIKGENVNCDKGVRTQVLKRKFTEDGTVIERLLSEGETSSGFETVSSINSNHVGDVADLDDIELSSLNDCDNEHENNFTVVVQIENELAYRNVMEPEIKTSYWNDFIPVAPNCKKDYYSSKPTKKRLHEDRHCRKIRDSNCNYKHFKRSRRDSQSSEREITDSSRRSSSYHYKRYSKDSDRKSRWSGSRSRRSRSSERTSRCRNSRSSEREVRSRSSSTKDRKAESRHSSSFDKYSSNSRRSSPVRRRRRRSLSRSPSVCSRLDSHSKSKRRRKERTPFLLELERKLSEAEHSKKEAKMMNVSDTVLVPQVPTELQRNLNLQCPLPLPIVPVIEGVYHFQYQPMPTLSTNNLPLVPGPTGLPVYISPTGEQIPHDMDGKCIPVGSNGNYLPVDPTGRLFPHIISPMNQAIPIHMTDDGVVRLPNSEPVPYGPPHAFPINVDGSVIYIGPDSKALYPYHNLPTAPPPYLLKGNITRTQNEIPQTQNQSLPAQSVPQPHQSSDQSRAQTSETDPTVAITTRNPPEANGNEDLLKNQTQTDGEKTENDLMSTETHDNLDSTRAVKRSFPVESTAQSKAHRNNFHDCASEIISESGNSVHQAKTAKESGKGSNKADTIIKNDKEGLLEIVSGDKSFKIPTADLISDDPILRKTVGAIKSLREKNYKPPVFGRFIISNFTSGLIAKKFPNESPLLRNRIKLPFVTPNAKDFYHSNKPVSVKKTQVTFKFLPQKSEKGERLWDCRHNRMCNTGNNNRNAYSQCDFTWAKIKSLNSKITELENEVVRLRKANANLLEDCRKAQTTNEKKSDELRKALLEIQEKNSEILSLKRSLKNAGVNCL